MTGSWSFEEGENICKQHDASYLWSSDNATKVRVTFCTADTQKIWGAMPSNQLDILLL